LGTARTSDAVGDKKLPAAMDAKAAKEGVDKVDAV
jgi:hypothetical protein